MIIVGLTLQILGVVVLVGTKELFPHRRRRFRLDGARDKARLAMSARIGLWLIVTGTATELAIAFAR